MKSSRARPAQIAEIANGLIDPILARRAGINTMLLAAWPELVGARFAGSSRPERIRWSRPADADERGGGFQPGQLTIACEGASAVFLMHEERELIARINAFFGFPAINQVRFVQKAVAPPSARPRLRPLDGTEQRRLDSILAEVEDPRLKAALERLGAGVIARRARRG